MQCMLSYDVCNELTVCRVNRVTSWSCDELTGSLSLGVVWQKPVLTYATIVSIDFGGFRQFGMNSVILTRIK